MPRVPTLYSLLIGIDYYPSVFAGKDAIYAPLEGCVADVHKVESFLKEVYHLPENQIIRLTASFSESGISESGEHAATAQNVVQALLRLEHTCQESDQIYIHYCGHGGRLPTILPQLKTNQIDEALVFPSFEGQAIEYLRDVEFAYLIGLLLSKGIYVTVVMDCCFAAGMTRGGSKARGGRMVDARPQLHNLTLIDRDLLASYWYHRNHRGDAFFSPYESHPKFVLLAACRAHELAFETFFSDEATHGALTYWWLNLLRSSDTGTTYRHLYYRLVGRIHTTHPLQNPQVVGNADLQVFLGIQQAPPATINVLRVKSNGDLLLSAGQAQGIYPEASLDIYPSAITVEEDSIPTVRVSVFDRGAVQSWAYLITGAPTDVSPGDQAVLKDTLPWQSIRRFVSIIPLEDFAYPTELRELELHLQRDRPPFIQLVSDDTNATFHVSMDIQGNYQIYYANGDAGILLTEVPHYLPAPLLQLGRRLTHLAKFHNVMELENYGSIITSSIEAILIEHPLQYEMGDPLTYMKPLPRIHDHYQRVSGEFACVFIRNNYRSPLNFTIMLLSTGNWEILQRYPRVEEGDYVTLEPGERVAIPLGFEAIGKSEFDLIKIFATTSHTQFRFLTLPPIDMTQRGDNTHNVIPTNPLERLLSEIILYEPTRGFRTPLSASPGGEWGVRTLSVDVSP
jgi:hypothetical protein